MIKIKVTDIFLWLQKQKQRYVLLRGGAGSSKSWSIAQHLINKSLNEKAIDVLVLRKTFPSLRISCMKLMLEMLDHYQVPDYIFNKTEHRITMPNKSTILFASIDQPEKYKSSEFNYIWMEEATEYNYDTFMQLDLRLRRHNPLTNQMFLSFNPISKTNWVYQYFIAGNIDHSMHISNYLNNPFLEQNYINKLLELVHIDKNYADVYLHGNWGSLENMVYSNYEVVETVPDEPDEVIYGMDFGFNHPSVIIKIYIKDDEYWLEELLYKSKLTNADLMGEMERLAIPKDAVIYADCAEPARIEEIYKNGWVSIHPAVKDKNSVKDGIDFCKRQKLRITNWSVNLIKEIGGYCWKEDKDGNVLDEPVKFRDDACDAFRYPLYTHVAQRAGTTEFWIG